MSPWTNRIASEFFQPSSRSAPSGSTATDGSAPSSAPVGRPPTWQTERRLDWAEDAFRELEDEQR